MLKQLLFGATTVGGGLTAVRTGVFGRNSLEFHEQPVKNNSGIDHKIRYHNSLPFYDEVRVDKVTYYCGDNTICEQSNCTNKYSSLGPRKTFLRPVDITIYSPHKTPSSIVSKGWDWRECPYLDMFKN